jgi:hypothetical protein
LSNHTNKLVSHHKQIKKKQINKIKENPVGREREEASEKVKPRREQRHGTDPSPLSLSLLDPSDAAKPKHREERERERGSRRSPKSEPQPRILVQSLNQGSLGV